MDRSEKQDLVTKLNPFGIFRFDFLDFFLTEIVALPKFQIVKVQLEAANH